MQWRHGKYSVANYHAGRKILRIFYRVQQKLSLFVCTVPSFFFCLHCTSINFLARLAVLVLGSWRQWLPCLAFGPFFSSPLVCDALKVRSCSNVLAMCSLHLRNAMKVSKATNENHWRSRDGDKHLKCSAERLKAKENTGGMCVLTPALDFTLWVLTCSHLCAPFTLSPN